MSNTATLPAPAEETSEATTTAEWVMDATQRCDRCGAQAYIKAEHKDFVNGLLFCNHHGQKRVASGETTIVSLRAKGWDIKDQSSRLYEHTKPDGGSAAG